MRVRWAGLFVAATVLLAACGAPAEEEGTPPPDAEAPDGEVAGVAGTVSVVITWTGSEGEAFEAVIAGFEERNPEVDVRIVQVPFGELNAQLTQQFAAGDPPDVATVFPGLIRLFAGQGFLMPIDDLWDGWIAEGAYTESLRAVGSVEGTSYGAWFKGNVNGLIWHAPATLERLGIEPPDTWDAFVGALDAAQAAGDIDVITVGGADQWPLTQWSDAVLASVAGPEPFLGLQDGSIGWDDPRVVEAFEVFADLVGRYFPATTLDRGFVEATCALIDGNAAFQNQGAFVSLVAPGECDPDLVPGEDFDFFPMPDRDPSSREQFISGDLFAVAADSGNPEAAKALVRYLGSADAQAIWAQRGGFIAPNARVASDVYPTDVDRRAAALFPTDPDIAALYDLDDFIGGEIQSTARSALQRLVRDRDVDRFIGAMVEVTQRVRGG